MYKLIVTENVEETQVHVNVFAKKQFTVIVEEVTV